MLNKILPLLSKYIPKDIASKGLSKIDKNLGKFIAASTASGYSIDQVLDFLRDNSGFGNDSENNSSPYRGDLNIEERVSLKRANQPNDVGKVLKNIGKAGAAAGILGAAGMSGLGTASSILPDEILGAEEEQRQIPYQDRQQLEYDPYDKRPEVPPDRKNLITEPPPEGKYPPPKPRPNFTPDFLNYLRPLIVNGTVDKDDRETIDDFWSYWQTTQGAKRSSPFVEFEKFRVNRNSQVPDSPSKQNQGKGAADLMRILEKLQQMRGGK